MKKDNERDGGGNEERPLHPMGVVSERTGLTPDVIRVWERRYGVVDPDRDAAGNRLYTDGDVARLRLLARAVEGGRSIGRIAALSDDALAELVRADAAARWGSDRPSSGVAGGVDRPELAKSLVSRGLELIRVLDGAGLEAVLERGALVLGARGFLEEVVAPLLRQVGEEWHGGELGVAHEHLASGVVVAVLGGLRGRLPAAEGAPVVVVATPSGERHEVGAMLAAAVAAAEGWRVLYLGPDLPAAEIAGAAESAGARAVALSVVASADPEGTVEVVAAVAAAVPAAVDVLVGGAGAIPLRSSLEKVGVVVLEELGAFESYLRGTRPS